jgi:hypothetical protein
MSIFSLGFVGIFAMAGIASMTDAFERGDIDEATRQGVLAGPTVVESGLASSSRTTQLASIASAPMVEDRAELLPALATLAGGPDRRTSIPAAEAARTIARELAQYELADDLGSDDIQTWRALYESIAANTGHPIEVRVMSLDTVASLASVLDPQALGFDLGKALADPDPAFRAAAVALVPRPTPAPLYAPLAKAVLGDADTLVAITAAQALCGDDKTKALPLLGAQGLDRIKKLVAEAPKRATRDAARCLAK